MLQAKKLYNALKESGDLSTLYFAMTGNWDKDKNSFIRQYNENEELINNKEVIDLDDIDDTTERF